MNAQQAATATATATKLNQRKLNIFISLQIAEKKENLLLRKLLDFLWGKCFRGHRASELVMRLCLNRTIIAVSCVRLSYENRKQKRAKLVE